MADFINIDGVLIMAPIKRPVCYRDGEQFWIPRSQVPGVLAPTPDAQRDPPKSHRSMNNPFSSAPDVATLARLQIETTERAHRSGQ
jgi:hypothetical protein